MNALLQQEADSIKFAAADRFEGVTAVLDAAEKILQRAHGGGAFTDEAASVLADARLSLHAALLGIVTVCEVAMRIDKDGVPAPETVEDVA